MLRYAAKTRRQSFVRGHKRLPWSQRRRRRAHFISRIIFAGSADVSDADDYWRLIFTNHII